MEVPMKEMPAKCGNCGYLFPSGYGFDPGETGVEATMSRWGNAPVSTPCPMCGRKMGRILEGEYNFVKDTITLLSGPESTKEDLERLITFLRESRKQGITINEIQERADIEIPDLSSYIRKLLAKWPIQKDPAKWISLLIATLSLMASLKIIGPTDHPQPAQVIYEYNTYNIVQCPPAAGNKRSISSNVRRNDPCPCGSGRKYKKCHGDPSMI